MSDTFWIRLCGAAGGIRTQARWRVELGAALPLFNNCLRKTGRPVGHERCDTCGCNHKVVAEMCDGGFVAICKCGAECPSRPMKAAEAQGWKFDGQSLVQLIAEQLPITPQVKPIGSHGLWEAGSVWMKDGRQRLLLVTLAGKRPDLEAALTDLFTHGYRDFLLLVAEPAWCGSDLGPRLESVGAEAYTLGSFIGLRTGAFALGALAGRLLSDGPVIKGNTIIAAKDYSLRCRGMKASRSKTNPRKMRLWAIRFKNREFDLPDIMGSEYLVHLLLNCKKELRPDELITALEGIGLTTVSTAQAKDVLFDTEGQLKVALQWQPDAGQQILDEKEIKRHEGLLTALEIAIKEAKDDPAQSADLGLLEARQDEIAKFLLNSTKPGPRGRRLPKRFTNDSFTRQADLVSKHVRKALNSLKANDKELWNHLNDKAVFRYGECNYYKPPKGVVWHIPE